MRIKILVVDDDEAICKFLGIILESRGFNVSAANSAIKALDLWNQMDSKPQLLISDLNMPEMGGLELAVLFRKSQPDIKILFITGFGIEWMEEAQSTITNSHSLLKPFNADQLISAVESAVSGP